MERVKLVIMVGILMILGYGCTEISNKNAETDSSTLTLNVNWDEAVANESTNKVIEDAITKGYKVYAGIIKSSEVDKSGTINFKEKQEISYRINKSIKFTIKESDYTKYHICIFIDKDGDGILSSWNNETIAYNYSLDVNSTSQTINMPIKINIVTSSSTLTFNVNWKDITATKSTDETIIEDAVSKGYKLYLGIIKNSEMVKGGIVKCTQQKEISYKTSSSVLFTIAETDYTDYQAYIYIDKDGDEKYNITGFEAIAGKLNITANSTSQIINMPITINSKTSSSNLTFNVTWNQGIANGVEKSIIDEAISKGYKAYIGIAKKSDVTRSGIFNFYEKQEIEYYGNKNVKITIKEADYGIYTLALFIDRNGDGADHWMDDIDMIYFKNITVNSISQTLDVSVNIN